MLEVTPANDLPDPMAEPDDHEHHSPGARLGAGPALAVMDRSMIVDPRLLNWLRSTAESAGIAYQYKMGAAGGTDAGAIHLTNSGVPSAVISVPGRYIHSPTAIIHMGDYDAALRLVQAALKNLSPAALARPEPGNGA